MRKENFRLLCHLLAGFAIITRAYQSFEQKDYGEVFLYAITGTLVLIIAGLNDWIVKKASIIEWVIFFIEGFVLLYIAFFDEPKKYYRLMYMAGGVIYLFVGVYFFMASVKKENRSRRRSKKHRNSPTHTGYKYQKEDPKED